MNRIEVRIKFIEMVVIWNYFRILTSPLTILIFNSRWVKGKCRREPIKCQMWQRWVKTHKLQKSRILTEFSFFYPRFFFFFFFSTTERDYCDDAISWNNHYYTLFLNSHRQHMNVKLANNFRVSVTGKKNTNLAGLISLVHFSQMSFK